uniref:Uncharacterized protein n=1 Tax=Branchiostoma floridae TaxID=7739 RepID=C3XTK9_BRAFL|eukprot:XP_002612626.1 hypothetical protein BRAFLDRAFT_122154 [Branchiostoma floridae]
MMMMTSQEVQESISLPSFWQVSDERGLAKLKDVTRLTSEARQLQIADQTNSLKRRCRRKGDRSPSGHTRPARRRQRGPRPATALPLSAASSHRCRDRRLPQAMSGKGTELDVLTISYFLHQHGAAFLLPPLKGVVRSEKQLISAS